jgi:hypothetical protein
MIAWASRIGFLTPAEGQHAFAEVGRGTICTGNGSNAAGLARPHYYGRVALDMAVDSEVRAVACVPT